MDTTISIDLGQIARELNLPAQSVQRTLELLEEGNTVPFITRFRKDQTGALDEEQIRQIVERAAKLRILADRKQTILKSIEAQGRLTPALADEIRNASSAKRLEDLYLPFKPKKQTLATLARQRGLEPLAEAILDATSAVSLEELAAPYVSEERSLPTVNDVIQGVRHLLAEHFSESANLRDRLRKMIRQNGRLVATRVEPSERGGESAKASAPEADPGLTGTEPSDSESALDEPAATELPANDAPAQPLAAETQASAALSGVPAEPAAPGLTPTEQPAEQPASTQQDGASSAEPGPDVPQAQANDASAESASEVAAESATSSTGETAEPAAAAPTPPPKPPKDLSPRALSRAAARTARANKKEKKRQKLEAAFKDYFQFSESLTRIPPHRVLAINRGERARILRVKLEVDPEPLFAAADKSVLTGTHPYHELLATCLRDALQRLVLPSLEREVRRELTEASEQHAVDVFIRNLRKLLLQPPVRGRRVLAVDPGFRNGCKLIALDEFGNVMGHEIMHVVGRDERKKVARSKLVQMIRQYGLSVVAVGNGTGCRETEQLVADAISEELHDTDVAYVIVNEAGASVYSTSPIGREELPDYDPVLRSAISIGRRLLDPLSELVKINPANIGVGLYQHDVKAKHLRESLDAVVESCVNYVGVDVNTASPALLRYVSGLNQLTARRLYEHRRAHGPFRTREDFKQVQSFGDATFVQAAGFLKINDGDNPLDATWIHPESYEVALRLLEKLGASLDVLRPLPPRPSMSPRSEEAPASAPATSPPAAEAMATATESPPGGNGQDPHELTASAESSTSADATVPAAGEVNQSAPETAPAAATADQPDAAAVTPASADLSAPPETAAPEAAEPGAGAPEAAEPEAGTPGAEPTTTAESSPELAAWEAALEARQAARAHLAEQAARVDVPALANELGISGLLLKDLLYALTRPGRDPREDLPPPVFRRGIMKLEDLRPGMELSGTVLNVVDFGAFVDIGLTESGLVHISRLADRYIRDPHEVVGVGDTIHVWVLDVDKERRRVSLTAVPPGTERRKPEPRARQAAQPAQAPKPRPAARPAQAQTARPSQQPPSQQRPPRRDRGKRPPARGGAKGRTWTTSSSMPAKPLTKEMEEGKEPLRSFADLLQFYEKKKHDDSSPSEGE